MSFRRYPRAGSPRPGQRAWGPVPPKVGQGQGGPMWRCPSTRTSDSFAGMRLVKAGIVAKRQGAAPHPSFFTRAPPEPPLKVQEYPCMLFSGDNGGGNCAAAVAPDRKADGGPTSKAGIIAATIPTESVKGGTFEAPRALPLTSSRRQVVPVGAGQG